MWKRVVYGGLVVVLCTCGVLSAATVGDISIGDISMGLGTAPFYQGAAGGDVGYFELDAIPILAENGILRLDGATTYDYGISGTITITRSDLVLDTSSGGQASGIFAGGLSVLTINGSLFDRSAPTVSLYTGDILVATMVDQDWLLEEPDPQDITGNAFFTPTSGGLYDGIDLGGEDILSIGDLRADLSFNTGFSVFGTDPVDFDTTSHTGLVSNIQIVPVPEPCTLILLSLGGLCVLRTKKNIVL